MIKRRLQIPKARLRYHLLSYLFRFIMFNMTITILNPKHNITKHIDVICKESILREFMECYIVSLLESKWL